MPIDLKVAEQKGDSKAAERVLKEYQEIATQIEKIKSRLQTQ